MTSGKFACQPPSLLHLWETRCRRKGLVISMEAFSQCFNDFVDNMKAGCRQPDMYL